MIIIQRNGEPHGQQTPATRWNVAPAAPRSGMLTTLCIMTIIGSSLGILRGNVYHFVGDLATGGGYSRGVYYILSNVGTLVGAIMMLNRSVKGLYVYSIFQVFYLVLVGQA